MTLITLLSNIADAIRFQEGHNNPIPASSFASRILALTSGGPGEIYESNKLGLYIGDSLEQPIVSYILGNPPSMSMVDVRMDGDQYITPTSTIFAVTPGKIDVNVTQHTNITVEGATQ